MVSRRGVDSLAQDDGAGLILLAKQQNDRCGFMKIFKGKMSKIFPKAAAAGCVKREQRSERGSHVGAETSQLQERNAEEKTNQDPLAPGGMLFCWCRE